MKVTEVLPTYSRTYLYTSINIEMICDNSIAAVSSQNLQIAHTEPSLKIQSEKNGTFGTDQWFADPVVIVVKHVAVPVEEVGEELPQVVVIRLLEEVQPPHVSQVGGHLFCSERVHDVKLTDAAERGANTDSASAQTLTREAFTEHFDGRRPLGVPDLLIPLLQSVRLQEEGGG